MRFPQLLVWVQNLYRTEEELLKLCEIFEIDVPEGTDAEGLLTLLVDYLQTPGLDGEIPSPERHLIENLTRLRIVTTELPPGQVGQEYWAELEAAGGFGPYTWSIAPGWSLPAGLELVGDSIVGTPVESRLTTLAVVLEDSAGTTVREDLTSLIAAARRRFAIPELAGLRGILSGRGPIVWIIGTIILTTIPAGVLQNLEVTNFGLGTYLLTWLVSMETCLIIWLMLRLRQVEKQLT